MSICAQTKAISPLSYVARLSTLISEMLKPALQETEYEQGTTAWIIYGRFSDGDNVPRNMVLCHATTLALLRSAKTVNCDVLVTGELFS